MLDGNIDANIQQIRDCLQKYSTWGENHIINICTDKHSIVPWGIEVYLVAPFVILFLLILVSMLMSVSRDFGR